MNSTRNVHTLLRLGLSFSFIYPAISALFNPYAWVGYFPSFLAMIPVESLILLHVFGVIEIALALWILFGKNIHIPAIIAAFLLFLIIVFNWKQMDVVFRDIPILFIAVALVIMHKKAFVQ